MNIEKFLNKMVKKIETSEVTWGQINNAFNQDPRILGLGVDSQNYELAYYTKGWEEGTPLPFLMNEFYILKNGGISHILKIIFTKKEFGMLCSISKLNNKLKHM